MMWWLVSFFISIMLFRFNNAYLLLENVIIFFEKFFIIFEDDCGVVLGASHVINTYLILAEIFTAVSLRSVSRRCSMLNF